MDAINRKIALGIEPNILGINKYGRASDCDTDDPTDIIDRANSTDDQKIWLAPTQARDHTLASSSDLDGSVKGVLTLTENAANTNTVTIGTTVYTFTTSITDVAATQTLTLDENAADTNTVTIGDIVYTFQDVLTDVAGNVLIGSSASDSIDNLIAAINLSAGGGTAYAESTVIHPTVSAAEGAGDTMVVTAKAAGTAGNSIVSTETLAGTSAWGDVNLTGGETNNVNGNVKIGLDASASIDNLIAAINYSSGRGTTYAALMTKFPTSALAEVGAGDTMNFYDYTREGIASTDTLAGSSAWGASTIPVGVGARKVKVYGLRTWADDGEQQAEYDLYGTLGVDIGSWVIIHRMKVTDHGATSICSGKITATAATDSTVTAQINAGQGQTQMAIYGIPSGYDFLMNNYYVNAIKGSTSLAVGITILQCIKTEYPTLFITKHTDGITTEGKNSTMHHFTPANKFTGPCIIKLQVSASADNTDCSGGFDGELIKN